MKAAEQTAAIAAMVHQGNLLREMASDPKVGDHPRLRQFVCASIPVYNIFAATQGWPQITLPAFCNTGS